jgi:hypothetical protein
MSPIIQKIFMLQRHQLIRWGTVNGVVCVTLSILFIVASILLYAVFNWQFRGIQAQLHQRANIERQVIDSRETMDELKSIALKVSEDHQKSLIDLSEMSLSAIQLSLFFMAILGIQLFGYGMLSFRAKKLASEANPSLRE